MAAGQGLDLQKSCHRGASGHRKHETPQKFKLVRNFGVKTVEIGLTLQVQPTHTSCPSSHGMLAVGRTLSVQGALKAGTSGGERIDTARCWETAELMPAAGHRAWPWRLGALRPTLPPLKRRLFAEKTAATVGE
ncbi:g3831 [Coccomyxa elongata]